VNALPDWLTPLPDAESMRAVDRWAIEDQGVPSLELMERAGAAVAAAVQRLRPDGPVTVMCGKGNNGGDGLVAARLLRQAGRAVSVVCTGDPSELTGDAAASLSLLEGAGPLRLDGSCWEVGPAVAESGEAAGEARAGAVAGRLPGWDEAGHVVVDALLGTGFAGEPRGAVADAIDAICSSRSPVVSVDVPSGVDASSGEISGAAVSAAATVSFHAAKPGLFINPGKKHAGSVRTADIGIPRGAPLDAQAGLMGAGVLSALPVRGPASTKFKSGQVIVVGGSRGLTGAPAMAARAAMRAGAGYVTVFAPASLQPVIASGATLELMTRGLAEDAQGGLAPEGRQDVLDAAARAGALALGPGLGRSEGAFALARELALGAKLPLVLDADGLNAHAHRLHALSARHAPTVLTPHAGELGRLLGRDSSDIEAHRLQAVREAAARAGAVVVLKGDDTLVAEPSGRVAVSPGGSPALATAGTGDVLTGVIAAMLAQGLEPFTAACAAVWLHACAGRAAALALGSAEGVIATDVIEALPAARSGAGAPAGGQAPSGADRA